MAKLGRNLTLTTFIAVAAGYVTGVLTAPKSGKETRNDIKNAALKTRLETERKLKAAHSELNDLIAQGKKRTTKLKSSAQKEMNTVLHTAGAAKQKAKELLSAMHDGGAEDKDLKKALDEALHAVEHLKKYLKKNA